MTDLTDRDLDRAMLRSMAGALAVFILLWAVGWLPYIGVQP